jgi:hypothetical protein
MSEKLVWHVSGSHAPSTPYVLAGFGLSHRENDVEEPSDSLISFREAR